MPQGKGDGHDVASIGSPLRVAALLALVSATVFLPLQLRRAPADEIPGLAALGAGYATVSVAALIGSARRLTERQFDLLTLGVAGGYLVLLLLHFWIVPLPAIMAGVTASLLLGTSFLLRWTTTRVAVLSAIALAGFAVVGALRAPPAPPDEPFDLSFVTLALGASIAIASARILSGARDALTRRQVELAGLATRLMALHEEERRRLSRALHDGVGQSLTAILSYLWLIERQLPPDAGEARERAAEARRLAARTMAELRELSQLLRPAALDDYGLVPSLETDLRVFAERHHVTAALHADGVPERLPGPIEVAVYRIAQEALANVARHARAGRVEVTLDLASDVLRLEVNDDGVGLPETNGREPRGSGLIGIRERVRALGGTMTIRSQGGTHLCVRLPLRPGDVLPGATEST